VPAVRAINVGCAKARAPSYFFCACVLVATRLLRLESMWSKNAKLKRVPKVKNPSVLLFVSIFSPIYVLKYGCTKGGFRLELFSYFLISLSPYFLISNFFSEKLVWSNISYFLISLFPYSKTNSIASLNAHYKYRQRCVLAHNCPLCRLLHCIFSSKNKF